ncbi:hypothetical protein [Paenibacillus marinisediminis]
MRRSIFVLLIFLFLVACSSDTLPTIDDFEVRVSTPSKTAKINEEIEVITELVNKSNKTFLIQHSDPLVTVQAYDEANKPMIKYLTRDDIGMSHMFKSKGTYYPEREEHSDEKRTIKFDKPGKYKLIGNASFRIEKSKVEQERYSLESEPYEILIEE